VFQECIMGLITQKERGGNNAAVASRIRVGHIPGGSTDAVAYS
jgi:ceramide kinase